MYLCILSFYGLFLILKWILTLLNSIILSMYKQFCDFFSLQQLLRQITLTEFLI